MTAREIIDKLNTGAFVPPVTCDTVKCGDENRTVSRLGVCMMPTARVLAEAKRLSLDMLIVHEPLYYNHMDAVGDDPVSRKKQKLAEESGAVIYRYHDHMHYRPCDLITEGELSFLGLLGSVEVKPRESAIITLSAPTTARALGELAKARLELKNLRIAGSMDGEIQRIGLCFGTPAGVFEMLSRPDVDCVMVGEACEWQLCEYARDSTEMGITKSVIVMGHIGSERDGMRLLADRLTEDYPELEVTYLECEEVYN